ncbi:hypothetical protein [Roseibium sp.]|uniref:hypothetical protein n=1 Tax=Roseibium sp. TaxID=1936156 RepID=UPI003B51278D
MSVAIADGVFSFSVDSVAMSRSAFLFPGSNVSWGAPDCQSQLTAVCGSDTRIRITARPAAETGIVDFADFSALYQRVRSKKEKT